MAQEDVFKKIVSHCKEYGFVFPSSEIYDGLAAVYDYGQNGIELKNNINEKIPSVPRQSEEILKINKKKLSDTINNLKKILIYKIFAAKKPFDTAFSIYLTFLFKIRA